MIQTIPLASLKASKLNVRKTGGKDVAELAASIRALGLQQNLGVVPAGKGFEVVFGGRRLRALQLLAKDGDLPESLADGVPCQVLAEGEAHEASLAENTIREAMHPLDQFAAFAAMAEAGKPVADIAAAFGVTERVVQGRMRLARVSPKLLKIYGEGGMSLEQLQAFAVSDDHAAQERVWKAATYEYDRGANQLRDALLRDGVTERDGRVRLVGLAAYEAAGGAVKRDMFSDTVLVLDEALLDRLVESALAEVVERVKAEGWSWVEIGERPSWQTQRIHPDERDPTDEEAAALDAADEAGDHDAASALEAALEVWPEGAKEKTGAVVHLGHGGVIVYRGLLRYGEPDLDQDQDEGDEEDHSPPAPAPKAEKDPTAIPARQIEQLTRIRTGELQLAMIADPAMAVMALAAHLAEDWRREHGAHTSGITIAHRQTFGLGEEYEAAPTMWKKRLAFPGPVLAWLSEQPWDTTLVLLGFLTAQSLDLVQRTPGQKGLGDELVAHFGLDMAKRWRPDAEFLQSIPAAAILKALSESGMKPKEVDAVAKLKKAALAGRAAEFLADKPWVPECLRLPVTARERKPKAKKGQAAAAGDE